MKNAHNDNELLTFHPIGMAADRVMNALRKSSKLPMKRDGSGAESILRQSAITERPERLGFSAFIDRGIPIAAGAEIDTLHAGASTSPTIGSVLPIVGLPQVGEAIVELVAVDVIDAPRRPFTGLVSPGEPMSEKQLIIETDDEITALMDCAGDRPGSLSTRPPNEDAHLRVVIESAPDFLGGQCELWSHSPASDRNKNQDEDARDDGERSDGDEKKQQTQLEYVEQRLRDLAEFEERARGRWKRPRRGA